MNVDGIIGAYIPEFVQFVTDTMAFFGGVFVAGMLASFLVWVIGYTVHSVFRWLDDTTSAKEEV